MAEKLATRLEKVQGEINEITRILRRAQDISEDDLMDGEYYIDQLNKAARRLNALSKKYEGCVPPLEVAQVNTTAIAEHSSASGKNLNSGKQDSDTDEEDNPPLSVRKANMKARDEDGILLATLKSNLAESDKSEEDVRISGQSGGSVDLDNVYNLCFCITNAFDVHVFHENKNLTNEFVFRKLKVSKKKEKTTWCK